MHVNDSGACALCTSEQATGEDRIFDGDLDNLGTPFWALDAGDV